MGIRVYEELKLFNNMTVYDSEANASQQNSNYQDTENTEGIATQIPISVGLNSNFSKSLFFSAMKIQISWNNL